MWSVHLQLPLDRLYHVLFTFIFIIKPEDLSVVKGNEAHSTVQELLKILPNLGTIMYITRY